MKYQKKVISDLNLCYSLAELTYKGQHCFLVAAEKHDPCYLFDEAGTKIAEPWAGPGATCPMLSPVISPRQLSFFAKCSAILII